MRCAKPGWLYPFSRPCWLKKSKRSREGTVTAQGAIIAAIASQQSLQVSLMLTPDQGATQAAMATQETSAAASAASAAQGNSAAATQIALAAQGTTAAATQVGMSAQQTLAAPGATPEAPVITAPPQAGPGRPPAGSQLFDDFSDNAGWPVADQPDYATGYFENRYFITIYVPRTDAWAVAGWDFTDVWMSTSGLITYGSMGDRYGMICRYQDNNNFYFLAIGYDSDYIIGKYRSGGVSLIGMPSAGYSPAINNGSNNEVAAWYVGNKLILTVNGVMLPSVYDYDLQSGDVSLIAMAAGGGNTSASYDYILTEQ